MNSYKIARLSYILKQLASLAMIVLPLYLISYWMLDGLPSMVPDLGDIAFSKSQLSPLARWCGLLVMAIPVVTALLALRYLRRLFCLYEKMEIFSRRCVKCIRRFGWTLLIGQLLYPLYCALMSLVLTSANPPGERAVVISVGLTQLGLMAAAGMILLISWVMEEGKKLQDEQAATV
jgi:hypothetical protein